MKGGACGEAVSRLRFVLQIIVAGSLNIATIGIPNRTLSTNRWASLEVDVDVSSSGRRLDVVVGVYTNTRPADVY
ncbi:hypothetical protein NHX12_018563 [Muraenolepis orangiensis]|uniref:Uncharacterized protein n=1 Tax=Muraenolepis orangiensis TaxID=630683 RepID=A0A9Q0IXQ6_9TELE|nr:hypothetical protein NHX12_018563 [Muraenolepis orangiensis]